MFEPIRSEPLFSYFFFIWFDQHCFKFGKIAILSLIFHWFTILKIAVCENSTNSLDNLNLIYFFSFILLFFSLDLNAAESGVQHKPANRATQNLNNDQPPKDGNCSCWTLFSSLFQVGFIWQRCPRVLSIWIARLIAKLFSFF